MQPWHHNLAIIRQRWPELARRLERLSPIALTCQVAKNAATVPFINEQPLHSLYNPQKEAQKLFAHSSSQSYLCMGLAGGYTLQAALETNPKRLIVLEPSLQHCANLLATLSYGDILADPRVVFMVEPSLDHLFDDLNLLYQPLVHGNLTLIAPRVIVELHSEFYQLFSRQWQAWMQRLAGELSTWRHFGRRWFSNIISNVATLKADDHTTLPQSAWAWVLGAGPSLEQAIPQMKQAQQQGAILIASDAAALTLQAYQLTANIIISIDASAIVRYHFLGLEAAQSYLVSDLSVQPRLYLPAKQLFFAGSHPLARLTGLRHLPTDAGNVGSVAYLLAKALQAKRIDYAGLDFCYAHAMPYARYSYLYGLYAAHATYLQPSSDAVARLTFRGSVQYDAQTHTYQSDLLAFYQQKFNHIVQQNPTVAVWQNKSIDGMAFIGWYQQQLEQLSLLKSDVWLAEDERLRSLYYTLLPAAAQGYDASTREHDLLQESLDFALTQIKKVLKQHS